MAKKRRRRHLDSAPPERHDPWSDQRLREQMLVKRNEEAAARGLKRFDGDVLDGFKNELTGLGDWRFDKTWGGKRGGPDFEVRLVTNVEAAERWRGDHMAKKMVEAIPDEMTREDWDISVQPDEGETEGDGVELQRGDDLFADPAANVKALASQLPELDDTGTEAAEALQGELERLQLSSAENTALKYERAFGGAGIFMGVDDGESLESPLDPKKVREVTHLTVFTGGFDGELAGWNYYNRKMKPKYGHPSMYVVRNIGVPVNSPSPRGPAPDVGSMFDLALEYVHESRFLIFPGPSPDAGTRARNRGWGDSLFTCVDTVLRDFNLTWAALANLLTDFAQGVLSIEGFAARLLKKGGKQLMRDRARAIQMTRSIAKLLVIDAKEKFTREAVSLAGVPDILEQLTYLVSSAADMPVGLLFGQRSGLNATGDADTRWLYDKIRSRQTRRLGPNRRRLLSILMQAQNSPTGGREPRKWTTTPKSLFQPTEAEEANRRKTVAETDAIYLTNSVVSAAEVAASRFGGAGYSPETTLDVSGRIKMSKAEAQQRAQQQAALVKPGPAPGAQPALPPKPDQVLPSSNPPAPTGKAP